MTAASLSNTFSLYNPPRSLPSLSSSSVHQPQRFSFSLSKSSSPLLIRIGSRRCSLKPPLCSVQSPPPNTKVEEDNIERLEAAENTVKETRLPGLDALLQLYKEAILRGDEKTISDVENFICTLEREKNQLALKVVGLSEEIKSGKEKCIRLQADLDNFRKRSEKEKLATRDKAQGAVIESLLPVIDNFERAKQQLILETEKEKKIDVSYQGIYKQFVEIMRSLNVAVVPTVGKQFDPLLHEAIAREESHEYREGVIIQELRRGFLLGGRLIRPAMVKVSSGPGKKKPSAIATEQSAVESTAAAGIDER